MSEGYKKGVCQCRSCNQTFHESEIKRNKKEHLGLHMIDTGCPYCGSKNFGLIDYPVNERDLIYKKLIHRNYDKKLVHILEAII